jgi:hypothetical protein
MIRKLKSGEFRLYSRKIDPKTDRHHPLPVSRISLINDGLIMAKPNRLSDSIAATHAGLTFYVNRVGKNLPKSPLRKLE